MKKRPRKRAYPLDKIRRFLEPGPVVLVSSAHAGQRNIMTMGWHMMMGFEPALFACYLWRGNHTYGLVRRSRECVINLPGSDLLDAVVGIGNCSGAEVDKFARFGLTAGPARKVGAPLIRECHANFECRLYEQRQTAAYHLFIWEVVAAHAATSPRLPETVHYRGNGEFMISGRTISRRRAFRPENL